MAGSSLSRIGEMNKAWKQAKSKKMLVEMGAFDSLMKPEQMNVGGRSECKRMHQRPPKPQA